MQADEVLVLREQKGTILFYRLLHGCHKLMTSSYSFTISFPTPIRMPTCELSRAKAQAYRKTDYAR